MTAKPEPLSPELQKAVALYYDGSGAPQVTAKGLGDEALALIEQARRDNIPLCDNPALVELLAEIEVGESIPEALYIAVAHIIAFAYQLRHTEMAGPPSRGTGGSETGHPLKI